jgi:hypothetical protein
MPDLPEPIVIASGTHDRMPQQTLIPKPATGTSCRFGRVERGELAFVLFFALCICLVTSLPYAVGHFSHFTGTVFTDTLSRSLDTNNYLAYINQSASGAWLFRNPMTGEPHNAVFFNVEWLAIGKLSFLLHLPPAAGMNVARVLCLGPMCFAVYWLSSFGSNSVLMRRIALVAVMAGGGFGWIAALHLLHISFDSSYFIDLTNGNLFPFYWALKLPHFLFSECFVVFGLCFFLWGESRRRTFYFIGAGSCYMLAGACRPYDMLFLMASTGVFLLVTLFLHRSPSVEIAQRSIPIVMCLPLLGYYYWIFKIHPIFRWWSIPGRPAPSVWLLALGYGLTFLFLIVSLWRIPRWELGSFGHLMLCCVTTAVLFAYAHRLLHFSFQFATNILIPLVMIVVVALEKPITRWQERHHRARLFIIGVLVVNSFSSIALAGQVFVLAMRGEFRTDGQLLEAYSWLDHNSGPHDVVLSNFEIASQIPQSSHNSVFCGYDNAVRFDDKLRVLQQFLDPKTSSAFREELIRKNAIQIVLLTPSEEHRITLGANSFVKEEFRNSAAVIFLVMDSARRF